MSRLAAEGGAKFHALDYPSGQIHTPEFPNGRFIIFFIKTAGRGDRLDLGKRPSADSDLKADLLNGRVGFLAKTDCLAWRCKEEGGRTS